MELVNRKLFFLLPLLFLQTIQFPTKPEEIQETYSDALGAILGTAVRLIRLEAYLNDTKYSAENNFMISPISVAVSLAQLILGTEGYVQEGLYYLLSLPNAKDEDKNTMVSYKLMNNNFTYVLPYAKLHVQLGSLLKVLAKDSLMKSFKFSCSSGWFVNSNFDLDDEFTRHLKIFYDSEIHKMNYQNDPYGTIDFMNNWTAKHTNHVIEKIFNGPLPPTTSAVFLNTVHFLAEWEVPFSNELNILGKFQISPTKQTEVTLMRGYIDSILYSENKERKFRMIGLPYKNEELMMFIVMPDDDHQHKYNMKKFVLTMKGSELLDMIKTARRRQVFVTLPKFKITSTINMLEPLEKFIAFKSMQKEQLEQHKVNANSTTLNPVDIVEINVEKFVNTKVTQNAEITLTKASSRGNVKLTNMIQEMTISVNEKGTEAAAVSLNIIDYIGGNKNFKVDRPFLFFIQHQLSTAALFWGAIVDPTQKN